MDQLWAPWRGDYVTSPAGEHVGCFLCSASKVPDRDRTAGVVHVAPHSVILLNRYPYSSGHLMVAPKSHVGDISLLDADVYECLMHSLRKVVAVLNKVYQPHGMNVGMNLGAAAGAGVPDHCHIHVVPRWRGDTNFMPVIGQVRVLSESLDDCWQRVVDGITDFESCR